MKKRSLAVIAAAALVGACIPSVNPFYTGNDVVFDTRLVGDWQEKGTANEPEVWKFTKSGTNGYALTIVEKHGKEGSFDARLFKLKDELFLDIIPTDCEYATNQADMVAASMFPGHLLIRVPQIEPELKLALFDFDWLEKFLEENPAALAHHVEKPDGKDGRFVLTASTSELQSFVLAHLGEGELFQKPGEFVRRSNTNAAPVGKEK